MTVKCEVTRALESPLGPLEIEASPEGVTRIGFEFEASGAAEPTHTASQGPRDAAAVSHLEEAAHALSAYFAGECGAFEKVSLAARGTEFEQSVWREMGRIATGETEAYAEIARRIGRPGAARAVGRASGRNPIPIIVPCHRVIGSDGSLTGYAGGVERKRWLLRHEGALPRE